MTIKRTIFFALFGCAIVFVVYWLWHIGHCLARRDFDILDKVVWTLCLLIPIVGLILYRGLGKKMYGKKARPIAQEIELDIE